MQHKKMLKCISWKPPFITKATVCILPCFGLLEQMRKHEMFLSNKDTVQILVANREVASSQKHFAVPLSHSIAAEDSTVTDPARSFNYQCSH